MSQDLNPSTCCMY